MIKLIQQTTYDRSQIKEKLSQVFSEHGLFETLLLNKKSILLKPNFVVPEKPSDPSTTHPDFYMAVAHFFLERGFKVGIGDSPAFGSCRKALQFHGVLAECKAHNIAIVEFKQPEEYEGVADVKNYQKLTIAKELKDWDAVINLPKIKVHQQFMFTAATKNLYGCVTGKRKFIRHNLCKNDPVLFAKMVLANAKEAACILHISDGIEAMHVKGPRGGKPYPLGKVIIARDYLEHDWLVCHLIGLKPRKTPLFKAVEEEKCLSLEKVCQPLIDSPEFSVAQNFIQSYSTAISFNPWHLLRSQWRSLKFKLKRA